MIRGVDAQKSTLADVCRMNQEGTKVEAGRQGGEHSSRQDVKTQVPNTELKAMVESYKNRAPQTKETLPRECQRKA